MEKLEKLLNERRLEMEKGIPIRTAMNMFLNLRLTSPSIWDFRQGVPNPGIINLDNGEILDGDEVNDRALAAKRKGKYDEAIYYYLHLFNAHYKKYGKLFVTPMRGYIKTLICANDFYDAFKFLGALFADMQQAVMGGLQEYDEIAYMLIQQDYFSLFNMAKAVSDEGDFSSVEPFCANYSGSPLYRMPRNQFEIREQFANIRKHIRDVYGQ